MTALDRAGHWTLGTKKVRRMGYGAMQLAGPGVFGPPKDHGQALAVLRAAIAAGVNHIDTSDYYGPYVTNRLIKEALAPYPDDLLLVTKVGGKRGDDASWLPAASPDELRSAIDDNLENLGIDRVEVVNMRFWGNGHGPAEGPVEEQVEALAKLREEGKILHVGLSNVTASQVEAAQKIVPIVCVQNMYNLVHREDDDLVDSLAEQGIAYVPFFPLGGFTPLQSDGLARVAERLAATPMQVALAWLLNRSPNILLIPGTSSLAHLEQNLAAVDLELDNDAIEELEALEPA